MEPGMKKVLIGLIGTGIVAGAGYGLALPATAAPSHGRTISFVSHQVSDKVFHLGKSSAFGVGLIELGAANDMQGHTKIGHADLLETVTRLGGGTADEMVSITFTLPGGQINVTGAVTSTASGPGVFDLAITGGTGAYASATGYARIVPSNSPRVTLHISG
jgi:hypothetical protein